MSTVPVPTLAAANLQVRSTMAGSLSVAVSEAGAALFDAGGREILTEPVRESARELIDRGVRAVLERAPELAGKAVKDGTKAITDGGTKVAMTTGAAVARVGSVVGRAGVLGAAIDGGFATVRCVGAVRRGEMTAAEARADVAKEAGTGAAASAAGVALAAGAVALLGPLAPGVLFGVGVVGSLTTKVALVGVLP